MHSNIVLLSKIFFLQILIATTPLNSGIEIDEELQSLVDQVSSDRIMNYVEDLAGFETRCALSENCNMSADYLYRYFASLERFKVTNHYFNIARARQSGINVVAIKNGTDKNDEYVLLFAHYDSISDEPFVSAPGADDNACGVAVMMEVASITSRCDLNRTLVFIAFSGEEIGLLGSGAWVWDNKEIMSKTVAAICLDGVGRGEGISIMFANEESRALAELALNFSIKLGLKNFHCVASSLGVKGSDSGVFLWRVPMVIRLWDEDRTFIHTPFDTPDTLYPNRLFNTAKVIIATLYAVATKPLEEIFPATHTFHNVEKLTDFSIVILIWAVIISFLSIIVGKKFFLRKRNQSV